MATFMVVSCRRGPRTLLPKTAFKVESDISYSDLWEIVNSQSSGLQHLDVDDISSVKMCHLASNEEVAIQSLDLPISVGLDLGMKGVLFIVENSESAVLGAGGSTGLGCGPPPRSAFDVLMGSQTEYSVPPKLDMTRSPSGFDKMQNHVTDWCEERGAGWSKQGMESGVKVIKTLTSALWSIEHHHDKFKAQGAGIPGSFTSFGGYRDFAKLHRKPPVVECSQLDHHCHQLATIASLPSMSTQRNKAILEEIEGLLGSLTKYRDHLKMDSKTHYTKRHQPATTSMPDHEASVQYIEGGSTVNSNFQDLNDHLAQLKNYEVVDLAEFSPADRVQRRRYIKELALSMPLVLFRVAYGGSLGTLNFVWKVDPSDSEADRISHNAEAVQAAKERVPKYASRAVRRDFMEKYSRHIKTPKSILRHMFNELTECADSAECQITAKVDERTAEFFMSTDDPEVLLDYRTTNGNKDSTSFEVFYAEVQKYFDEQLLAVDERRHGSQLHLPLAVSIEDLRNQVAKRLPEGTAIPSKETLRLQFHPMNTHVKTSERFTGRFDVKFRVQTRLARMYHPDSRYVATQYQYLKEFAVLNKDDVLMVCMDDKATVPVGEPGFAISTGVRGHNRVLAPATGPAPVALDHDFHVCGIVPSVSFVLQIPEDSKDSFFQGQVFVTTKDKIFQPSSPLRHTAELITVLSSLDSYTDTPDGSSDKSVLLLFTDGGPDHRVTYDSVKLSLLSIFMEMDLDMLIALRTAPHNSWVNPAERVMSVLNLALQHVALERAKMADKFESKVKNKGSMTAVRNAAEYYEGLEEEYVKSTEAVIDLVNERFERMNIKGTPIQAFKGASKEDVEHTLNIPRMFTNCDQLTSKSNSKAIKACGELQAFIKKHEKSGNYCFQLRKCTDQGADCDYCSTHPVRMEEDKFRQLHYLPDPVPDADGEHYQSFSQLYGKPTTDRHRPSLVEAGITADDRDEDKRHTDTLKSQKVRSAVICAECQKPRCVYLQKKMSSEEERSLQRKKEEVWFTCGESLGDPFITRRSITCASPMEAAYYSNSVQCLLLPVCWHCGSEEQLLDDFNEYIDDLSTKFTVVRPICQGCRAAGKEAKTWGQKFFKKRRTT